MFSRRCRGTNPPIRGLKVLDAKNSLWNLKSPFDNEADPVALVQDAFEFGDPVGAGPLEGDLVGNTDDLHGPRVTRYLTVGDRHHVVQTQGLSWGQEPATNEKRLMKKKKRRKEASLKDQSTQTCKVRRSPATRRR